MINYKAKTFLNVLVLIFTSGIIFAQKTIISGTVKDQSGPLIGATIVIKGTTNGTITDFDGNFILKNVPLKAVELDISFIGYQSKKVKIIPKKGKTNIGITILKALSQNLEEVVVTALGIKREAKKLAYSVQKVTGKEIAKAKEVNVINSLSGKLAGVQVTGGNSGVGSSSVISIRGEGSLTPGANSPLFVVDGVPINNDISNNRSEGNLETDYGNGAQDINPDDIATMTVLKGPNATALYGSRGANGVILITTKSGKRTKGLGISYTSSTTFETILRLPRWQNQYGQGKNGKFSFANGGYDSKLNTGINDGVDESWGPKLDGRLIVQHDSPTSDGLRAGDVAIRPRDAKGNYTDTTIATPWIPHPDNVRNFFRTGFTTSNSIALTGGNENGDLRISLTNLKSEGILPNTDYNRKTYTLKGSYHLADWLKVSSSFSYVNSFSKNRPNNSYGTENIMYLWMWFGRHIAINSLKNYWQPGQEGVQQFNYNYNWHDNPYFTMYENTNSFDKNRLIGNARADITFTKDLSLMIRTGLDYSNDLRIGKRAYSTQRFKQGQYREGYVYSKEENTDFLFAYNKEVNEDFSMGVSFGGNLRTQENRYRRISANALSVPGVYNLENAAEPLSKTHYDDKKEVQSLYAFANFAFKNYLFLDITGRNDWSSTLPENNNSYFYPSVGLSAILSDMVELPDFISFAKFRAGWAIVGNDTSPYRLRNTYGFSEPFNGSQRVTVASTLANAKLKPEKSNAIEFGADIRLFHNRLGFDVAVYKSDVKNQILRLPVSITSGNSSRFINAGAVENKGIEITMNVTPIRTDNFRWKFTTNFTANRGTVKSLIDDLKTYKMASNNGVQVLAKVGHRMGDLYGTGFKKVTDRKSPYFGSTIYNDQGLPITDPTLVKLGNYNPDFMVGFQNSLTYKNFNFSFLFDWRQGGVIHSRTIGIGGTSGELDFTAIGRETGIVGNGVVDKGNGNYVKNTKNVPASSYYSSIYNRGNEAVPIFDASYVKLREVKVSYNFPKKMLAKTAIQSLSLSLVGRNLALWTQNKHVDPETFSFDGNTIVQGLEDMATPSTRSFGLSLNVQF